MLRKFWNEWPERLGGMFHGALDGLGFIVVLGATIIIALLMALGCGHAAEWQGPRLTVSAGAARATADLPDDLEGAIVGVGAGYDWRLGGVVVGVAGDYSLLTNRWSETLVPGISAEAELDQLVTLRGRVGVPLGSQLLVYATGGLALGHVEAGLTIAPFTSSDSQWRAGWTVGVGLEWAFAPSWTVGVEYLHADLGSDNVTLFGVSSPVDVKADVVRAQVTWRF